jgi:branched-chain amino acid transport system permease protein
MSAANWRNAMNSGAGRAAMRNQGQTTISMNRGGAGAAALPGNRGLSLNFENPVRVRHIAVLIFLVAFPWFATPFFTYQIGAQSLALGLITLSLTFLGGYGGMVSLAQMTIAGIAGYLVAILGFSGSPARRSRRRSSAGCRCAPRASTPS